MSPHAVQDSHGYAVATTVTQPAHTQQVKKQPSTVSRKPLVKAMHTLDHNMKLADGVDAMA
jgi:hypothetical protein